MNHKLNLETTVCGHSCILFVTGLFFTLYKIAKNIMKFYKIFLKNLFMYLNALISASTHQFLFQVCAKAVMRMSWMRMKANPPTTPT